jgi:hypothetical protein
MRGQPVDHIPFIGRMDMWYSFHRNGNTLPALYERASLWDIQRDLGIGIFGFGAWDISFYRLVHHLVEVRKVVEGEVSTTEYHTPYGVLTSVQISVEGRSYTGARIEYPFKDVTTMPRNFSRRHCRLKT